MRHWIFYIPGGWGGGHGVESTVISAHLGAELPNQNAL